MNVEELSDEQLAEKARRGYGSDKRSLNSVQGLEALAELEARLAEYKKCVDDLETKVIKLDLARLKAEEKVTQLRPDKF
jgi:hypothetical protein